MKEESQELTIIEQPGQTLMTKAQEKRELKIIEQQIRFQLAKQKIFQDVMISEMESHHFYGYGNKEHGMTYKLTRAGAQHIRQFAGIKLEFTALPRTEGDNDSYLHQCICKATLPDGETCEALGSCSSKHKAFGTGTHALESVDEANIIKTAHTNAFIRCMEIFFGLSGIPEEKFFEMANFMPNSIKYQLKASPAKAKANPDKVDTRNIVVSGEVKAMPWRFLLLEFSERANDYYKLTGRNAFIIFLWYETFGDNEKFNNRRVFLTMDQITIKKDKSEWNKVSQVQKGLQALLDALN